MDPITSAAETTTNTCAYPGCGNVITGTRSLYVDGCGHICRDCEDTHFPVPEWFGQIEPPF